MSCPVRSPKHCVSCWHASFTMLFPPKTSKRDHSPLRVRRRYWRSIILFIICLYLFTIYCQRKHPFAHHAHQISVSSIAFERLQKATDGAKHGFLGVSNAHAFCAQHNWNAHPTRYKPRKLYDMTMLNNELDWLEIRLNTMAAEVDYFVVLESRFTFTGLEKELVFTDEMRDIRFGQWKDQIIYVVVEGMPLDAARTWDLEDHQRNTLLLQGVLGPTATGPRQVEYGDILIVADMDEIVRPAALMVLRQCDVPNRVNLRSKFYYYGFQWLHSGEEWMHPQATVFRGSSTILPADLRNGEGFNRIKAWWDKSDLWNAGWHCSSCFEKVDDILIKMQSFSHTSLNKEKYRDKKRIVDRVKNGLDLWDRPGEEYLRVEDNEDIPDFLKESFSKTRFAYLLDRDGPSAGFTDYKEEG
ncbi:glycosyltransferase family 17 protein [Calycina marina]|uniref:Glycosyltransferase family 17 protein n=1 Tax=Calycina marina TaxID=1763456 RepID=A0A9P7YZK7_9HELO|nr:glycosyltransferase family 17 protein [Calycina marina]